MKTSLSSGAGGPNQVNIAAGQPDIFTVDFSHASSQEAQFILAMPKGWNVGTLTAEFVWSQASTSAGSVVWGISAVAMSNGDSLAQNFGTEITVTAAGGTTNVQYVSSETSAITPGGTVLSKNEMYLKVRRLGSNGSDTLTIVSRLHGVRLYYTASSLTDA